MKRKIHRWQPTGLTPCGRRIHTVTVNEGKTLSEGVTCLSCLRATTLVSLVYFDPQPKVEWQ